MVPSLLMMVCGYGSVEAGIPLFVTGVAHLSVHFVGLLFFVNTTTIVLGQAFVLGSIRGRSRSLMLGVVGLAWGLSWLFATASLVVGVVAGVAALCVGQMVFAFGETVFQPIAPVLVNELAPEHLRGRYNSLVGTMWTLSAVIGQLTAGLFLEFHQGRLWTICLAAGAVLGGLGLTTMRRTLSAREDGRLQEAAGAP
jgi:MFS family permease